MVDFVDIASTTTTTTGTSLGAAKLGYIIGFIVSARLCIVFLVSAHARMNDYRVAGTSGSADDVGSGDKKSSPVKLRDDDDDGAKRSTMRRKRKLSAVDNGDGRRRRRDDTAAVAAKREFDVHAAQLLDILHHNFAGCLFQRRDSSSSAVRLTPVVGALRQFVASAKCLEWRTFWHDAYGIMCKTMHFFDAPLNTTLTRNDTVDRLFCPTRLATIARTIQEHHNVSSSTLCPAYYTELNNDYKSFYSADRPTCREENVRVYKRMWSQMTEIATAFIDIVWDAIERHIRDPIVDYLQLCDYLKMMYETAMLGGHVLLAAPLSQFVPLRVVQVMNRMRLCELKTLIDNHGDYGMVYNTVVAITLVAAMHFSVLLRGLRPARLWPFSNSRWPEFIRNNTAIISYHFLSGLTGERLLLVGSGGGGECGVGRREEDYVAEIKLKSAAMIAACSHDEYVDANETNSIALAEYLDLISPDAHPDGVCLLSRDIELARKCYSCDSFSCGIVSPCYHDDENDPEPANDHSEPAAENSAAVQCNVISSTVTITESWWHNSSLCPLWAIVKSDHYTLEEKDALTNSNFINLAALRQHACSNSHDAILDYQAFGLRSFPYNYRLSAHLNVLRHLFVAHTSRLVTQPLPLSITESAAV